MTDTLRDKIRNIFEEIYTDGHYVFSADNKDTARAWFEQGYYAAVNRTTEKENG